MRREKIPNKLDFSGKLDKYILNNILKVLVNPPWANLEIQDGVQDGCRASRDTSFAPYFPNYWFYADSYINGYYRAYSSASVNEKKTWISLIVQEIEPTKVQILAEASSVVSKMGGKIPTSCKFQKKVGKYIRSHGQSTLCDLGNSR